MTVYYVPKTALGTDTPAQQRKLGTPGGYVEERFCDGQDDWGGRVVATRACAAKAGVIETLKVGNPRKLATIVRQASSREPVGRVGQWEIFYVPNEDCFVIDMPGAVPTHGPEYSPAQFPTKEAAVAYAESLI